MIYIHCYEITASKIAVYFAEWHYFDLNAYVIMMWQSFITKMILFFPYF